MALSDTGWTAVGAVGGALVGSLAGGLVTAHFAWRRRKALTKAGARLVAADISMAASQLASVATNGRWYGYMKWRDGNWEEYRGVLAERLSGKDFETVNQSVIVLKEIFDGILAAPTWPA